VRTELQMKLSTRILGLLLILSLMCGCNSSGNKGGGSPKDTPAQKPSAPSQGSKPSQPSQGSPSAPKGGEPKEKEQDVKTAQSTSPSDAPDYVPAHDIKAQSRYELPQLTGADKTILQYDKFIVSYDQKTLIPRWVAYELTPEMMAGGATVRSSATPDPIYSGKQATLDDYRGSGWAKGPLASPNDFKASEEACEEAMYLTNCCPMKNSVHNGQWSSLDHKVQGWAEQFGKIYIVSGPIIGSGKNGTIGENEVAVPDAIFKAILVGGGKNFTSIAFIIKNAATTSTIKDFAVPVSEVEKQTGLTLFGALPDKISSKVKGEVDFSQWDL